MYHELRKRGTSAAYLKFLQQSRRGSFRNFKSKSGTRIIKLLVPPLLPKFVSEGAAVYHELRKRGTRFRRRLLRRAPAGACARLSPARTRGRRGARSAR